MAISDGIAELDAAPLVIVGAICLLYLVLGFFMDQMAILALTVPLTRPVVESLGYDPIWFGIVVILLAEIGLITPPFGLNAFVVAESAKIPMEQVFRGSVPYVLALAVVGALLVLFPDIVLFLPNSM
ncbi:TRAP transporter large permease subunit [Spiractinospora alimapuensis]|uniref:TRAP transporter large permease subunit n=1 Tax=Spiractinospora alimapuensis TaxID=2820884 RepID=UPI001F2DC1E0|nr:TRAP transporter large permease subunit [Spiractinospora alimapuensis]QVQ51201.1 TRAP transporter large permease subunit [Spiractinospora alimapuensis]